MPVMLVVRTDPDSRKHKGLSYLLVDMSLPGIDPRPMTQITGEAEFNEVFFDNVRVPVSSHIKTGIPGHEGSIGKLLWSEPNQRITEAAVNMQGPAGQVTGGTWSIQKGQWQYAFLRSKGNTIEAGTSEIQRNIIATRGLGLPGK